MTVPLNIIFTFVLLSCVSLHAQGQDPSPPRNLLVEYLPSPVLGLDVQQPRFSWECVHVARAQTQTAYEVIVRTGTNNTVVWTSGKTASSQSTQVVYNGPALVSDKSYTWVVRWWDVKDTASAFSSPASFDTGFFSPSEWKATWIAGGNRLRTEFTPDNKPVSRARLYVCGLGYYVARINGQRVGDKVLGPFTQYDVRILYDTYDVTHMITAGTPNALAVALGKGFYAHHSVNVGGITLLAQISVTFSDGSQKWVALTDTTTWKVTNGPLVADDVYMGMDYDARLETPGWDRPNYDASKWKPATVAPTPKAKLTSHLIHPQKKITTYPTVRLNEPQPNVYVFDIGQNIAGWSKLRVKGDAGTTITLQHSEMVDEFGMVVDMYPTLAVMIDKFTLAGTGDWEEFETEFVYHGFQYVQVTGFPGVPTVENLSGTFIHSALPVAGAIETSNPVLNNVDYMTRMSAISNFQSIPTDCPTREKRGWLGDAQVSAHTQMYYWDMAAAYTKFVQDIHDSQVSINQGGVVGDTAPWFSWGGAPADPSWATAYVLLWYWSYEFYGDLRMLQTHYDSVKLNLDATVAQTNKTTGLLTWGRYGDWCAAAKDNTCAYPSPVISSFYYLLQLELFSSAATILGKDQDAVKYTQLAANVRAQWNAAYYNPSKGTYMEGYQTLQVLPLIAGVVRDADLPSVVNYFLNDVIKTHNNHLTVGVVGARYLLPALQQLGRSDVAYAVLAQTDYPSWQWFSTQGGTTLWEIWWNTRTEFYGTRNHIMYGGQAAWSYTGLAGINQTPKNIGFKDIAISPVVIDELSVVSASLQTHRGVISSSWEKHDKLCSSTPENQNVMLTCDAGVISKIIFASFGTPSGNCGNYSIGQCNANTTVQIVEKACVGKQSCTITVSDATFGDPCFGNPKRLITQFDCSLSSFLQAVTIPVNSMGSVVVPKLSFSNLTVFESGKAVWANNKWVPGVVGIVSATDSAKSVTFRVGSGSYSFVAAGAKGTAYCQTVGEGEIMKAACPRSDEVISHIQFAHFGTGSIVGACGSTSASFRSCTLGSSKHVIENACLYKNSCAVKADVNSFADPQHMTCGNIEDYYMHVEYICSN